MAKRLPPFYAPITIDVEGDITKTRWLGTFNAKRVLTWQDQFDVEKYYKQYLIDDSMVTNPHVKLNASILAELRVRVQSGPSWWEDTRYGLDLIDETPLHALMIEIKASKDLWDKELAEIVKDPPKGV